MNANKANERLATDLEQLMGDAEELVRETAGEASEKVKEVRNRLARALESAKASCANLQDKTIQTAKRTDRVIRDHPYESIGIALGLGLLVGALFRRR